MIFEDLEVENKVLGSFLNDRLNVLKYLGELLPLDFVGEHSRSVFETMQLMVSQNLSLDLVSVSSMGKKLNKTFTDLHLIDISTEYSGDVKTLVELLKDLSAKRSLHELQIELGYSLLNTTKNNTSIISDINKSILGITNRQRVGIRSNEEISKSIIEKIRKIQSGEIQLKGLTGIAAIDQHLKIDTGELITIGAGSGVGKSWLANVIAGYHDRRFKSRVLVFSMEMTDEQVAMRALSYYGHINSMDIREGKIDTNTPHFKEAIREFNNSGITICDRPSLTIHDVESIATQQKYSSGLDMIILDHGLLMDFGNSKSNDADKIGKMTARLKGLTKGLGINTVLLWQLTKDMLKSAQAPTLKNLRSSGSVIQDSDSIVMLFRPELAGRNEIELNDIVYDSKGITVALIEKNRWGLDNQKALIKFDPEKGGYSEYEYDYKSESDKIERVQGANNFYQITPNRDNEDIPF